MEVQKEKGQNRILPFVPTYYPALPNLKNILMSKWHLIQNQLLFREIFKELHLCYFIRKRKILKRYTRESKTLMRSHFHTTIPHAYVSCLACPHFILPEKSIASGDFWVLPRWWMTISRFSRSSKMAAMSNSRPWSSRAATMCQNPYPGESSVNQFPAGSHPPWGLTLIGALCPENLSIFLK